MNWDKFKTFVELKCGQTNVSNPSVSLIYEWLNEYKSLSQSYINEPGAKYYRHWYKRIGNKTYTNWQVCCEFSTVPPNHFITHLKIERDEYCDKNRDAERFDFKMSVCHEISMIDYYAKEANSIPINQYIYG